MSRLPENYRNIKGLVTLDDQDLDTIKIKAKGLSLDECFDYLCLTEEDLTPTELRIASACDSLFIHMKTRNGGATALEYLKQHSSTFSFEATPTGSPNGSGFSFNVNMNDK